MKIDEETVEEEVGNIKPEDTPPTIRPAKEKLELKTQPKKISPLEKPSKVTNQQEKINKPSANKEPEKDEKRVKNTKAKYDNNAAAVGIKDKKMASVSDKEKAN